jgi:hypothetical protein
MPARRRFISVLQVRRGIGGTHKGDRMISDGSDAGAVNLQPAENGGSQATPSERVRHTLMRLHRLLQLYAPVWYTEELQKETEAALGPDGERRALGLNSKSALP